MRNDYHVYVCVYTLYKWYHTSAADATTDDEIQEIFHHNLFLCIIFSVIVVVILPQLPFLLELQLSLVQFLLGFTRHSIIIESILFTFCFATAAATVHLYIFLASSFLCPQLSLTLSLYLAFWLCQNPLSSYIFNLKLWMQQHPTIAIIIDDVHTDLVLCCEMKKSVSERDRGGCTCTW